MTFRQPDVLVFDVNETLVDLESLTPLFEQVFGDASVLREWYAQLITYSMAVTVSGDPRGYVDLGALAQGVLRMVADAHHVDVADDVVAGLPGAVRAMPPHPDVPDGLRRLRAAGFRLATLTNSPPAPSGESPLERAGLADLLERQFSIDEVRAYKPAPTTYGLVVRELQVEPASCMLVAAHPWDLIGAQRSGFAGAFLTRPGNAMLAVPGLPTPDVVATDLGDLADQLIAARGSGDSVQG